MHCQSLKEQPSVQKLVQHCSSQNYSSVSECLLAFGSHRFRRAAIQEELSKKACSYSPNNSFENDPLEGLTICKSYAIGLLQRTRTFLARWFVWKRNESKTRQRHHGVLRRPTANHHKCRISRNFCLSFTRSNSEDPPSPSRSALSLRSCLAETREMFGDALEKASSRCDWELHATCNPSFLHQTSSWHVGLHFMFELKEVWMFYQQSFCHLPPENYRSRV